MTPPQIWTVLAELFNRYVKDIIGSLNEIVGFAYTPQDGNSLLSSVGATVRYLYPESHQEKMKCLDQYLYSEV